MAYLFILPALFSLYFVVRNRPDKAFLNVYLPCTFFVPYYYQFRVPHLPDISAGVAALIPIGLGLLVRPRIKWKFRIMDLLVVVFLVSQGLSELLKEYNTNTGMQIWLSGFFEMFLAYIVGRQVIEPDLRLETVKRIVFLFALQAPFALFEFRFGQNLWLNIAHNVFRLDQVGWFVQLRGGFARIATCFAHAILAGIMFLVAMALNYYLVQIYKRDKQILGPRMSKLQKYRLPFILLPIFVLMTNSRMPMACTILVFLFLQIPKFKSIRTGAAIILSIVVIGGSLVFSAFLKYTSVSEAEATDEAQTSAIYRRELLDDYAPILEEGGWLGWGVLSHPLVEGLGSIDNNYMLIQLAQGKLGLYTFYAIVADSLLSLSLFVVRFKSRESLFLVFSLMGALVGTFLALGTVFMGEQLPQVLFLLLGWSQSLQDTSVLGVSSATASALPEPKFRFRRVIA